MSAPSQDDLAFFHGEWKRLEQVVERFEEAWQRGERPVIDAYLAAEGVEPRQLILELVLTDLECGLKAGEPVRVETYLSRYAELGSDRTAALRLIEAEYRLRRRREPGLGLAEYLRRFPQYRPDLGQLLQGPHFPPRVPGPSCQSSAAPAAGAAERERTCPACGADLRPDGEPPASGSANGVPRLGQFELLETIGEGAFGIVYRARDAELDRIVAVKVPRLDQSFTPADVTRFLREARNAAGLSHPGIVPVYEVGRTEAVPYLVSAYIEGVTLAAALTRQRLTPREAAEVVAQVAEALDHAHRHGVVHRDLKPSNIMLGRIQGAGDGKGEDGAPARLQAFVMDFGLARRDEGESRLTVEGQILGTPAYMSPEQARGQGHEVDGRSDVYSLGVILYELLTGELPFRGVARMVLQQILSDEPRPPRRLNDRIPRDLETIALKCLTKEPGRRYATAAALAADLRRHLAGEPILARPVGPLERCRRWARRNPRVAGLSAAVLLLLLTVLIGSPLAVIQIDRKRNAALAAEAKAWERLELSLDANEQLVYRVQEHLGDRPGMLKLKEDLLRDAVTELERVAGSAREPRADRGLASAHQRLGDIFLLAGRPKEARDHYEQCREIAETLAAAEPDDPQHRRALCVATAKLGEVALRQGDLAAARAYCGKALELGKELAASGQGRAAIARDLARCYGLVGTVNLKLGNPREAVACHRTAAELAREALAVDPQSIEAKQDLAIAHDNLGDACLQAGDVPAARAAYATVRDLCEALAKAQPENARARRILSVAYEKLGDCELRAGAAKAAGAYYRKALDRRKELATADPYNPLAQRDLAVAYVKVGEVSERLDEAALARDYYRKALDGLEKMAAASPDDLRARHDVAVTDLKLASVSLRLGDGKAAHGYRRQALARFENLAVPDLGPALAQPAAWAQELLGIRARVLAARGEHAAAAATAARLRELAPADGTTRYDVACCYALCAAAVAPRKAPHQLSPEEAATRARYTTRALEDLAEAVRRGYQDVDRMESDPDLAALRSAREYQRLLERLRTTPRAPGSRSEQAGGGATPRNASAH